MRSRSKERGTFGRVTAGPAAVGGAPFGKPPAGQPCNYLLWRWKMKRPKQLPAVDRNAAKTAAVPVGANVQASAAWWETALQAAPGIIGGLGSLF